MALSRKTINFLPSIFQTDANKKFLTSTLDQLVSEPDLKRVNAFIGRQFGPGHRADDNYISESSLERSNYQLEVGLSTREEDGEITSFANYTDILNSIKYYGGLTEDHNRLFSNEYYSYNPLIDLDKLVNFKKYYWLPIGPETIKINGSKLRANTTYNFVDQGNFFTTNVTGTQANPIIYVKRGTTYTFNTSVFDGNLFVQTEPGKSGKRQYSPGTSTREIAGLINNGGSTITFTPPNEGAQDFYLRFPLIDQVEYAINSSFTLLDNAVWNFGEGTSNFLGLDQFYPDGSEVIFISTSTNSLDWTDRTGAIVPVSRRTGIWRINMVKYSGQPARMQLEFVRDTSANTRVVISQGYNSGKEYYHTDTSLLQEFNGITTENSKLFYQHSNKSYYGTIEILDNSVAEVINVDNIIGLTTYTTPDGIEFTNGLKIQFDNTVFPTSYRDKIYIVEGVGSSIQLVDFDKLIIPELSSIVAQVSFETKQFDIGNFDETGSGSNTPDYIVINRSSADTNPWSRINRWFHEDVIAKALSANGANSNLDIYQRAERPIIEFKPDLQLYNFGKIFKKFIDQYFDSSFRYNFQAQLLPLTSVQSVISNARLRDLAAMGIVLKVGQLCLFANDQDDVTNIFRINYLDQIVATVFDAVITGSITIAVGSKRVTGTGTSFLTQVEVGTSLYLSDDTYIGRVAQITSNTELLVDSEVTFFASATTGIKVNHPRAVLSVDSVVENNEMVAVTSGNNQGKTFYYNSTLGWKQAQQKSSLNQAPLFDIVNSNNQSLETLYPESSFRGSKIFSYAEANGEIDSVLGFAINYGNSTRLTGDIVFTNNYDSDVFYYRTQNVLEDRVSKNINLGYILQNKPNNQFALLTTYTKINENSKQYQHISYQYDAITNYFEVGISPEYESGLESNIKVFINYELLKVTKTVNPEYSIQLVDSRIALVIDHTLLEKGDKIDIFIYSKELSSFGFYAVPKNLELNPYNKTFPSVNFGQLRKHFEEIGNNSRHLIGNVFESSNIRDLDYSAIGGTLIQHSASLLPAMSFLTNKQINFCNSIEFAAKEYSRFKYRFFESISLRLDTQIEDVSSVVDEILIGYAQVKNTSFPWYYSDMLAFGTEYLESRTLVTNPAQRIYPVSGTYGSGPSQSAIIIYLNNKILTIGKDYTLNANKTFSLSFDLTFRENDILIVREYSSTNGCYIPETPTKLGLYPSYVPERLFDDTFAEGLYFIQGHDGSLTPAFNDIRDDIILELETRIYNNIKVSFNQDLFPFVKHTPGKFRTTDYSRSDFNSVLGSEFLKWVGFNQINFTKNDFFESANEWTWNYNQSLDLDQERLPGYWRGIYKYFYDTDRPHSHPWEMLGFTVKPSWWDEHYSWTETTKRQALITAIVHGRVGIPTSTNYNSNVNSVYARPDFAKYIPVDTTGLLLSPQKIIVASFDSNKFSRNFSVGDYGPVESAWARTSDYAFAVQRAFALLKPAQYFGLLYDTYNYTVRQVGNDQQYLNREQNVRPSLIDFSVNGLDQQRSSSYLNWIHGYITSLGIDAGLKIKSLLNNSSLNLSYRFGGFTDKKYINVIADQINFTSSSETIVIPDESYKIYLNKGIPAQSITYSAVVIEKTENGFAVTGYDQRLPFFNIIPSDTKGSSYKLQILGQTVTIFEKFRQQRVRIPYGFEFVTIQQVSDFLVGYQRHLVSLGLIFDQYDANLSSVKNWILSIQEFLTWAQQGWGSGNILVLSPIFDSISVYAPNYFVDGIENSVYGSQIIATNSEIIRSNNFTVIRDNKRTTIQVTNGQTIGFVRLNLVQYEHVLVLDNVTIFNDTVYKPELGDRQLRLKLVGAITNSWDGDLTPAGFVYSNGEIDKWQANFDYRKGTIIDFKGINYSALEDTIGSDTFESNKWVRLDSVFRQGLAPNLSTNALKFQDLYNVDTLPVDESLALYSNSLIGYKPRNYFDNLGISPTSQIKFYQGYIKTKGTLSAIQTFAKADFNKRSSNIEVYEEWAARIGSYGAIDSNPEYSFSIKNNSYDSDPLLYQFVESYKLPDFDTFIAVKPADLLSAPENYDFTVFENRNSALDKERTWRIELFGDSVMCGKNVTEGTYSVDIIKRHGYSIDVRTLNQYSVTITDQLGLDARSVLKPDDYFKINYTSVYPNEILFLTLEPVTINTVPSTKLLGEQNFSSVDEVYPGTELGIYFTSKNPYERIHLSVEPVDLNEVPDTMSYDGYVFEPSNVTMGAEIYLQVKSVFESEKLYWSIEEVEEQESPNTTTTDLGEQGLELVCLNDKVTGRVAEPPDYVLYQTLKDRYNLAITTRSVEGSTTRSLLDGTDGVNGPWPDNIDADIIVINHGLEDAKSGVSLEIYRNNLKEIRSKLPANKIVIWQTPGLLDISKKNAQFQSPGTNNLAPYATIMRSVAHENGDYIVDLATIPDYLDLLSLDGVHPTQQGYQKIVETLLAPVVEKAIADTLSTETIYYEDDLLTAGYVLPSEVDAQIFDISDSSAITPALMSSLINGYKIWVAKDFNNDWQVYRSYIDSIQIVSARADTGNRAVLTCNQIHELMINDLVAIRGLHTDLDGFYRIMSVAGVTFTVEKSNLDPNFAVTNKSGQLITQQPLRFATLGQARSYVPKNGWLSINAYRLNDTEKKDLWFIDRTQGPGTWATYRPRIFDYTAENIFYSNVITSNTYSIIGIDCLSSNAIVSTVDFSSEINFCIFSTNESEDDLYYSIEVPRAGESIRTVVVDGQVTSFANSTVVNVDPIYIFTAERSSNQIVDISKINNLYIYGIKEKNIVTRLDLLDPVKGKILGPARENLDMITDRDPASYRNTNSSSQYTYSTDFFWGEDQIGTYWWNTDRCRFITYEQGDLNYRKNNWGKVFPGSQIEVYEWIASDVLPSVHIAEGREGTPLYIDDQYYSDSVFLDTETGSFVSRYFFWVKGRTNKSAAKKSLSTVTVEQMILEPAQQGIPYMVALRDDAIALYNTGTLTQFTESALYIATKTVNDDKLIHSDFQLVQQGNDLRGVPNSIENKLIDSLVGFDENNNPVPDPRLPSMNRIGLAVRPRQTLIVDSAEARKNIIKYLNEIFLQYPIAFRIISKQKIYSNSMFARDPEPANSDYDAAVNSYYDLYSPLQTKSVVRILVRRDTTIGGYWSLYERTGTIGQTANITNSALKLVYKQGFDVTKLWEYADWYATGYTKETKPTYTINRFADIYKLNLVHGDIVLVRNIQGSGIEIGNIRTSYVESSIDWEMYLFTRTNDTVNLELIGLKNKTIQLRSVFYQPDGFDVGDYDVPVYDSSSQVEFRYILKALKQDIFVADLKSEYSKMLFALVDYILTEQKFIDWFFKTSFITVKYIIDGLTQNSTSVKDAEDNIREYINEVKPYRTKIREFITNYNQIDTFYSSITDFDLPAYYDKTLGVYRSPSGEYESIDPIELQRPEYTAWRENYKYNLDELAISSSGYGYQTPDRTKELVPDIEIYRSDSSVGIDANAVASVDRINYGINKVTMTKSGTNYTQTPRVKLIGAGGTALYDDDRHQFTVVTQGYSYFTVGPNNKLGFGLFGRDSRQSLQQNYQTSKISTLDWSLGSGGTATFPHNGGVAENERVRDTDPWNNLSIVWECRPDGANDADGGWNGTYFNINPEKTYRSVVWIRRTSDSTGGTLYHGLYTNGSYSAYPNANNITQGSVRRLSDGLAEWNPYWNYLGLGAYNKDEWYLHVGHIFPSSHVGTTPHPDSGIYTRAGGRVFNNNGNINDGKFPTNATQAMQRCYHYYSPDSTSRSQFAFPRFEELGQDSPSIQDLLDYGPYQEQLYTTRQRGYHMHRIRRSDGKIVFSRVYDLYAQNNYQFTGYSSKDLASDLNNTPDSYVVVVHTYDEPYINRFSNELDRALKRCGASDDVFGKPGAPETTFKFRSGYILVGIPGCGSGKGIEHYAGSVSNSADAYASVTFKIERGYLAALRSDPKHYVFNFPFQLPAEPGPGTSYKYGERYYIYNGKRWNSIKTVTSSLPGNQEPKFAVLSARLSNKTVRKVHTTIRFDRVQYTSQVQDWRPNVTYTKGTYLSYQGSVYQVANLTYNVAEFITSNLTSVSSSYFDNANDRIMGFYVQTADNIIPKQLGRLVPGIDDVYSTYVSTGGLINDTILVGDTFGSNVGISAGNIKVTGGKFVDRLFAQAPEELLPGIVYDSLSIRVLDLPAGAASTTTTTTAPPAGPLTLGLVGPASSTVEVPYFENSVVVNDTFAVNLVGAGDPVPNQVTVSAIEKPSLSSVVFDPLAFNLVPGQQQVIKFTATNSMLSNKDWYDLSSYQNDFTLSANSVVWSIDKTGSFNFNTDSGFFGLATSGTMTGINTIPGGYNTVCFWMKWTGDQNGFPMEWKSGYRLWMPNGALGFNNGQGDLYGVAPSTMAQYQNDWVFITAIFHNTFLGSTYVGYNKLFINGNSKTLTQVTAPATSGTAGIGITIANSTNPSSTPDSYEFDGAISEFYVYNRELTSDEIYDMYYFTKNRYAS